MKAIEPAIARLICCALQSAMQELHEIPKERSCPFAGVIIDNADLFLPCRYVCRADQGTFLPGLPDNPHFAESLFLTDRKIF